MQLKRIKVLLRSEIEARKGSLDPMKMQRADGKREQSSTRKQPVLAATTINRKVEMDLQYFCLSSCFNKYCSIKKKY